MLRADEWRKLELTVHANTVSCYVDGSAVATHTLPTTMPQPCGGPLLLMAGYTDTPSGIAVIGSFLDGAVDGVEVWKLALDSAAIQHRWHHRVKTPVDDSLLLHLSFDEGRGLTASDSSGRGNDAYLVVSATGSTPPAWTESTAGIGDRVYTREDTAIVLWLNATDAQSRLMMARIMELPTDGSTLVPIARDGVTRLAPLSSAPVDVPLGRRLLLQPPYNSNNISIAVPFKAVVPEEGIVSSAVSIITVLVEAVDDVPRVAIPTDMRVSLLDFRIEDVDVGEANNQVRFMGL